MISVDSDDARVGRVLSRREVVALAGLAGAAVLARTAFAQSRPAPACVVRPEQTEKPFFVEERLERGDIRSDPATGERRPGPRGRGPAPEAPPMMRGYRTSPGEEGR